nr:carboxypeptidase-like regulatory domain-containing protein [Longitalea luteola]
MILKGYILLILLVFGSLAGLCQVQIQVKGKVFDMTQQIPLVSVSVMSTGGTGTTTDSLGRYSLYVRDTDSIWFSYLGKGTPKYPVASIPNQQNFEISLHVNVTELKPIMVKQRNYHLDSIANREEYAKAFNYKKPGLGIVTPTTQNAAVGVDLDQLIDVFNFRKNRRMAAFRDRLIEEEKEKYIDHRFSRPLVVRLTGLRGAELDTFMKRYRPDLVFIESATDYELQSYIKQCFEKYTRLKQIMGELQKQNE